MTNLKKDVLHKRLLNSVKYLYLSLRLVWSLFTCKKVWKQMWKQAQGTKKVVEGSNVYDWPCFLFPNAMTVLTVDEMAFWSARSGKKQTILLLFSFFSSDFYSIMRFKENSLPDSRIPRFTWGLTSDVWHQTSDIRQLKSDVWQQTPADIRWPFFTYNFQSFSNKSATTFWSLIFHILLPMQVRLFLAAKRKFKIFGKVILWP